MRCIGVLIPWCPPFFLHLNCFSEWSRPAFRQAGHCKVLHHWLISPNTKDPDLPSSVSNDRATYEHSSRLTQVVARVALTSIFILFLFATPALSAHAGVFSFLTNLFNPEKELILERTITSQNIALLAAALHPDPNLSKGGGEITIIEDSALLPDVGPLGTIADVENRPPESDKISIYVVREGDSLSQIARMFGVSINTIIWANDINRGDLIRAGQTLVILPVSGIRHTVKEGETLAGIAKKFKGDVEEIEEFNGITDSSQLVVGQTILIPDGELGTRSYVPRSRAVVRGNTGPNYSGYYIAPANGNRTQGLHGFNAVDLGAAYGAPVVAAASGTVIINRPYGWNGGYGVYVVIAHPNGTQTLYAHLSTTVVYSGQHVVQGQVIGYAGSSGRSTGPHVHFEVRGAQNPL